MGQESILLANVTRLIYPYVHSTLAMLTLYPRQVNCVLLFLVSEAALVFFVFRMLWLVSRLMLATAEQNETASRSMLANYECGQQSDG